MAVYRPIQISYWLDPFVIKLTPEEKFFYIYLMTNAKTSQCGIYELSIRITCLETGYNEETIKKLIEKFIVYKKILFDYESETVFLLNWIKYNQITNVNVCKCVINELKSVKNEVFLKQFWFAVSKLNDSKIYNLQIQGAIKGLVKNKKGLGSIKTETETPTETETLQFEGLWNLYDKKIGNKTKLIKKWSVLSAEDKEKIIAHIPGYVKSTPDKKYRKNFETYLNNRAWEDEIIGSVSEKPKEPQKVYAGFGELREEFK